MHQIGFVLYPGFELLDMAGPASVFNGANQVLRHNGQAALYEVALYASRSTAIASSSGVTVQCLALSQAFDRKWQQLTLLIAGGEAGPLSRAMADADLRHALPSLVEMADRFGSVCSGGLLLAKLGLIDGCRVATHWDSHRPFQQYFPNIVVDPEVLYVQQGKLWTSAGVSTGIDMALAMVAVDLGAAMASQVAKRLILYAHRPGSQSQFSPILQAQRRADDPYHALVSWIADNLSEPLDVASLAQRAGQSERSFQRKFSQAMGISPARFIENLRLDQARLLLSRDLTLKEIAAQIGLYPPVRMGRLFEKRFGISPATYRAMHVMPGQ